jgi:hypothetical protein
MEEEEEDFDVEIDVEDGFESLYLLVESLFERELFNRTLERSMETYNNELFQKKTDRRLVSTPYDLAKEEHDALEGEKRCYICLEGMNVGEKVVKLACNHLYHHECVQGAVEHQHTRCPLCRSEIAVEEESSSSTGQGPTGPTGGDGRDTNPDGHYIVYIG